MRTTPRRIARLLAVYAGTAFRILVLGRSDDPDLARGAGVTRR
ncbi:hypothetical protein ACH4E7_28065 [Kitasatospora sp. NPDC018058]